MSEQQYSIPDVGAAIGDVRRLPAQKIIDGFSWPEIPRWHDDSLWFSDLFSGTIRRLDADGAPQIVVDATDRQPLTPGAGGGTGEDEVALTGMGWLPDGRLIVNSMRERVVLVWDGSTLDHYADLRDLAVSPINDMVVDAAGRAYITQFGYDLWAGEPQALSPIIVVEPDQSVHDLEGVGEFAAANGITITADGSRLITTEMDIAQVTVLDLAADGTGSGRRVFARTPGLADGICLDDDGGVWCAMPGTGYVVRFTEGGQATDAIEIPVELGWGVAPVLGGVDRSTLFIACGLEVFDPHKSRAEGRGSIWAAQTSYHGGDVRP